MGILSLTRLLFAICVSELYHISEIAGKNIAIVNSV